MKTLKNYLLIPVLAFMIYGCTDDFLETNTNPNGISEESLTQMNNNIGNEFDPMFLSVIKVNPEWQYQLQQNLIGDVYSGYMTPPTPFAGNVNNMTYALVDGWNGFPWSISYSEIMPKALNVKNAVTLGGDPTGEKFVFLANIIKVFGMHRISDIYGPIRYSKYNDFETTGEYDSQEQAYLAFFNELGEAIDGLEAYTDDVQFQPFDKSSLGGDITKWRKFANSLRLRLALRVSKVNPELAKTQGELALNSNAGLIESENVFINSGGFKHPINTITNVWGDVKMSAELESILNGFNDPRIEQFFSPAADEGLSNTYKGIRMGIDIESKETYLSHSSLGEIVDTEQIVWMTSAEVHFLQAEAALRGWAGAGSAQDHYEAGITASFNQHGVSGVGDYINDNISTPADYVDDINPSNNYIYPSDVKIAFNSSGTNEEKLEQIITQKWIAMFPDGQEAWSEFRRTGYPRVFPVVINNSGNTIDTQEQIKRINFVQNELNTNAANVEEAKTFLNGPDNGGTSLWWDVDGPNF